MKILALDLGDKWTGSAISDPLQILAKPYKTIDSKELIPFLKKTIEEENIKTVVLGYPRTMKGRISEQTQKVLDTKKELEKKLPDINWILWDERLTSKIASTIKKTKNKEEKLKLHSIAAALVLETYLTYLNSLKTIS